MDVLNILYPFTAPITTPYPSNATEHSKIKKRFGGGRARSRGHGDAASGPSKHSWDRPLDEKSPIDAVKAEFPIQEQMEIES